MTDIKRITTIATTITVAIISNQEYSPYNLKHDPHHTLDGMLVLHGLSLSYRQQ